MKEDNEIKKNNKKRELNKTYIRSNGLVIFISRCDSAL